MALVRRIATEMMRHATSGDVELDARLGEIVRRGYERPPRRAGCSLKIVVRYFNVRARGDRNWVAAMRCDAPRSNPLM